MASNMDPNDFYFSLNFGNNYEQITTDWAVWGGDLHSNHAVLKHVTCQNKEGSKWIAPINNKDFYFTIPDTQFADVDFDIHKNSSCIACGEKVPEYVKKLLILNNMDIDI